MLDPWRSAHSPSLSTSEHVWKPPGSTCWLYPLLGSDGFVRCRDSAATDPATIRTRRRLRGSPLGARPIPRWSRSSCHAARNLAALEQLPDAPVRFRKTLPPTRPLHAPGLGTVCPQVSRTDRGLQHGSGQRSPQRLISQEITRVNKVVDRLLVECHDCGEKTSCIRLTAQSAEPETGYRDEMDLCAECWEKREASRG
jgi:hypothetical protein